MRRPSPKRSRKRRPAGRLGEESTKADIKKELFNKVLWNASPRKLRRT